jgi:hypothetical protein
MARHMGALGPLEKLEKGGAMFGPLVIAWPMFAGVKPMPTVTSIEDAETRVLNSRRRRSIVGLRDRGDYLFQWGGTRLEQLHKNLLGIRAARKSIRSWR